MSRLCVWCAGGGGDGKSMVHRSPYKHASSASTKGSPPERNNVPGAAGSAKTRYISYGTLACGRFRTYYNHSCLPTPTPSGGLDMNLTTRHGGRGGLDTNLTTPPPL